MLTDPANGPDLFSAVSAITTRGKINILLNQWDRYDSPANMPKWYRDSEFSFRSTINSDKGTKYAY